MVGGNPRRDVDGFRYWQNPGAFVEYVTTETLGQFEGFLVALWSASFTCVGPEYVSIMAAEAKHPRFYVKTAFKVVYWRLAMPSLGGALAVDIPVPYNDPTLTAIFSGTSENSGSAAASPYIIAMSNLGIDILPYITILIATAIFSAGNTYTYCARRSLYGLALEGRAPKFLRKCTKKGVPIYFLCVVMLFPFLSFLQVSSSSATVLGWLIKPSYRRYRHRLYRYLHHLYLFL
ncbi:Fc.00g034600.m01.CDS01 [Cosmosporella sp. VM-42]